MPKNDKGETVPLTPEQSRSLGGASAMLEELEKKKAAKAEADSRPSADEIEFKKVDSPAPKPKKSKPKRSKPVVRNSKTGRLEAAPVTPLGAPVRSQDPKPYVGPTVTAVTGETLRPATNTELRRGIPSVVVRDQTRRPTQSAGPRLPRIGQIYKHSDGRMLRVSADNIDEIHTDAKRTVLPTAGREDMMPAPMPAPLPGPRGGLRKRENKNNRGNKSGLGVAHEIAKEHVDRAFTHLDTMAMAPHGSMPYKQAQKGFHQVHGQIGEKNMSKSIHTMLQLAHNHIDSKLPGTDKMLTATKEAVGDKLREGKRAEEERTFRQIQTDKGGN